MLLWPSAFSCLLHPRADGPLPGQPCALALIGHQREAVGKGRQASETASDGCYTEVDLYLAFDSTDTGTYTVVSYSWAFCPVLDRWFWNGNESEGSTNNAYPVSFTLTGASDDGGGVTVILERDFAWQSSDGNPSDLSNCQMREKVTYSNTNNSPCPNNNPPQACYYPPSPPWPVNGTPGSGYPNPTLVEGPASACGFKDYNSITNLSFVKPYSGSSFNGTQYYQYSCNGGDWTNIYGPTTITRSLQNSQGKWVATASASDTTKTSTYVLKVQ